MKKALLALLFSATFLQAAAPTSQLLKPKPKDSISYLMVGATAPFNQQAMDALAPNLSYGMRHFGNIHAKDYCLTVQANQQLQTLSGQYSFLFFPITTEGFSKTHSSLYLGLGLSGGVSYLSRSFAKRVLAIKLLQIEPSSDPKIETPKPTLSRFAPALDLPISIGYQFANTNFIQVQLSTLKLINKYYSNLPGNGVYATLNYGFGF